MFGPSPNGESPPPERTVWADDTLNELTEVQGRLGALIRELREREGSIRERCNHTYRDGRSALELLYDYDDDTSYTRCKACGRHP